MRIAFASIAAFALLTAPALAYEKCWECEPTPIFGWVAKIVGTEPAGSSWDGAGGQCTVPGSDAIWVGPHDANCVCLTPASIVGSQGGAVFQYVYEQTGEIPCEYPEYSGFRFSRD